MPRARERENGHIRVTISVSCRYDGLSSRNKSKRLSAIATDDSSVLIYNRNSIEDKNSCEI